MQDTFEGMGGALTRKVWVKDRAGREGGEADGEEGLTWNDGGKHGQEWADGRKINKKNL